MIADITNTAIDLAHHTRKTGGAEVTVEDGRGAVALLNAVRPARVINVMTEDEALKAGIVDGRRRYFKVTDGKNNLALPLDKLDWFRSESVFLGNGDPSDPSDQGDNMGVVTNWEWPNAMEGIVRRRLREGEGGDPGRGVAEEQRAKDWVGHAVAKALGLGDVRTSNTSKTSARGKVNTWSTPGSIRAVWWWSRARTRAKTKDFVEVAEVAETPMELAAE